MMILAVQVCFADIVYFKDGRTYEGQAEEIEQGVWVDGILFEKDMIDRVEKRRVKRKKINKREIEAYKQRRQKTDDALQDSRVEQKKKRKQAQATYTHSPFRKVSQTKKKKGSPSRSNYYKSSIYKGLYSGVRYR